MRAAAIPTLALPLLLTYCGAKGDLIIGELEPVVAGSAAIVPAAGTGAAPATAGSDQGGVGGGAGSAGSSAGLAGSVTDGGTTAGDAPLTPGGAGAGGDAACIDVEEPPPGSLIHRYSFDGTGATVVDSVGGADGMLMNGATLDGSGVLTLPGEHINPPGPDEYANLPNGLISSLTDVTIIAWTTWRSGGSGYERIFDFGSSDIGEGQGASGKSYLAVMSATGFTNGSGLGAEIAAPGFATQSLGTPEKMDDRPAMVALTLRSGVDVALFLDGKLLIQSPTALKLSNIKDVNDFIGESQWMKDHAYQGTYSEFRIYNAALGACQLQTLFNRGADVP